ncbi:hypothetical protein G9A89_002938 [Geosiphon pyriformis]|nr:hypothetical protein G9A89_002938 [Geosiphon pyriformis]
MSTFFDAPASHWTYDAIVANYCLGDNISRVLHSIKKDLQQRAKKEDCDATRAIWLLKSGWQLSYCMSPSDDRVPMLKVPKGYQWEN